MRKEQEASGKRKATESSLEKENVKPYHLRKDEKRREISVDGGKIIKFDKERGEVAWQVLLYLCKESGPDKKVSTQDIADVKRKAGSKSHSNEVCYIVEALNNAVGLPIIEWSGHAVHSEYWLNAVVEEAELEKEELNGVTIYPMPLGRRGNTDFYGTASPSQPVKHECGFGSVTAGHTYGEFNNALWPEPPKIKS